MLVIGTSAGHYSSPLFFRHKHESPILQFCIIALRCYLCVGWVLMFRNDSFFSLRCVSFQWIEQHVTFPSHQETQKLNKRMNVHHF
ncbi:CLUMA_CG002420, isoform A [Clunio marinus]|uniref:CLUMA_CG002420, isoform A n=1 Tax=Clunio marinus TaxID=568069 RepID=A0A1J1HKL3_9DIPT|nr:CLUMA_CG002420, isoform A [Clunio marinus]